MKRTEISSNDKCRKHDSLYYLFFRWIFSANSFQKEMPFAAFIWKTFQSSDLSLSLFPNFIFFEKIMNNLVVFHVTKRMFEIFIHTVSMPYRWNEERYRFISEGCFYKNIKRIRISLELSYLWYTWGSSKSEKHIVSRLYGFLFFRNQPQRPRHKGKCESKRRGLSSVS